MEKILISVILPVYNAELYLKDAIDSILAQTYANFELIILNDGSTDASENIILSYKDSRIRYIKNDTNLKLIKTLNKGIYLARGVFVARMDSDDISLPNRFYKQITYLLKHNDVDMVSCKPYLIDSMGKITHKSRSMSVSSYEAIRFVMAFDNVILHPGVMIRKSILEKYQYSDTPISLHCEDYDLWVRMLKDGCKIVVLNEYLFKYRLSDSSICSQNANIQHKNGILLRSKYFSTVFSGKIDASVYSKIFMSNKKEQQLYLISRCYILYKKCLTLKFRENREIQCWFGKKILESLKELSLHKKVCIIGKYIKALVSFFFFVYLPSFVKFKNSNA